MKILHICLAGPYTDNYSYQENLLSKYHKRIGNQVIIIASKFAWNDNGNLINIERGSYINADDIQIVRISCKKNFVKMLRRYKGLRRELERCSPEILFIHGVQFQDIKIVIKYIKKNPQMKVYIDNHADFSNSACTWLSKNVLHKIIWKHYAKKVEPYVEKFYGVLPARVDFLTDVYGIAKEKVELLVMGADDELVEESKNLIEQKHLRERYGLKKEDIVIITGGKIDGYKKQTLLLMEAIKQIEDERVRLIVFGSVTSELKTIVEHLADGKKVQYIGWLDSKETYKYFAMSDIVCFPGRHSVFWEQVVAQEKPLVVKYWEGTTHVDYGGNVRFLYEDSVEEIKTTIKDILKDDTLEEMKKVAKIASKNFMYSEIAKKSINYN